jgi:small-conductance mechanosensitive channel
MGYLRRRTSEEHARAEHPRRRVEMPRGMFETRSEAWREAGLSAAIDRSDARRARLQFAALLSLIAGVLVLFSLRRDLFPGYGTEVRIGTVIALIILGWGMAKALGTGLAPSLFKRLDPGTAGTVGFVIRLLTIVLVVVVALRIAGLRPEALAVGGAFTAVVVGLASQQTLGNVFAGIVLQGTRPFRVGERVRLTGGPMAGSVEGTVSSLGLLYATFVSGADRMMVPNSVLLQVAVVPLREPERIDLRARFDARVSPARIQEILDSAITVPTRYPPDISLEEIDRDDVVLRIAATPERPSDGAKLAEEILTVARREGDGAVEPEPAAR